jgi:hypothetical protein
MSMPELREEVRSGVTWKLVAELIRRHHAQVDLRIYETHPGGGLYDCLSLFAGAFPSGTHLCDFNQASAHLHAFGKVSSPRCNLEDLRWPDGNDYVLAYLRSEDPKEVVDQIGSILGLPVSGKVVPPITAPVLAARLIAEIMSRSMLDRFGFDVRSGYIDTSGGECGLRDELKQIPSIASPDSR